MSDQPLSTSAEEKAERNRAKKAAKMGKFLQKTQQPVSKPATAPKKSTQALLPPPIATEKGEKKDMGAPMAAVYSSKHVELAWADWWDQQGFYKPNSSTTTKSTYVIPIPPPNVTGSLHLGHALTIAIQDCMIRWNRMRGLTTLYVPGCDHAGIATQSVVERRIWKESKQTRHDLGRDRFLSKIWEWKEQYGGRIYDQFRRLGASADMDRACFTMDPKLCKAVNEAFVRLHDEGIIYRATRLVNWCSHLNTALSNLEVDSKELSGKTYLTVPGHDQSKKYEFGVIISFAYPIENSEERIIVATTRIETMLGDTAIAVNPTDDRYKHLHGKFAIHPFSQRRLPIITDNYVDITFGTGAVKLTPAHDPNDFDLGKRHQLEFINILNDDGSISIEGGAQFSGLKRFDARVEVIKALKAKGLYIESKDNPMAIPICSRSGDIIEPRLKPQWYVECKDMAKDALTAVRNGDLDITPKTSEREWFRWLENIQDWCISRQLWWGHRIPAYLIKIQGKPSLDPQESDSWVSGRDEKEALEKACNRFPDIAPNHIALEQDHDVLDTWFSSALWPFSTLGWPDNTLDMQQFYPTTLLETGWDILFFWVARMVMMGIKLTGTVPFKQVFCHAMVRDAHGRKMSKALGNVIDPLDVIEGITLDALHTLLEQGNLDPREVEKAKAGQRQDFPNGIPECGADALRFALCAYTSTGRDLNLDILRVEGYRKFCNKLWNATRFALLKLGENYQPRPTADLTGAESLIELWILHKLNRAIRDINAHLTTMSFMNATSAIHQLWLYEICDVFIEAAKPIIDYTNAISVITPDVDTGAPTTTMTNIVEARQAVADSAAASARATLYTCLDQALKLLHPFMPFVTEELWQRLPRRENENGEDNTSSSSPPSIMVSQYPTAIATWDNDTAEHDFDIVNNIVRGVRSLMADYNITSAAAVYVCTTSTHTRTLLTNNAIILPALCKGLATLEFITVFPTGCATISLSDDTSVALMVRGTVDVDSEVAKARAKLVKVTTAEKQLRDKTTVNGYESKVKLEVRQANDVKLKAMQAEVELLNKTIEQFLKLNE